MACRNSLESEPHKPLSEFAKLKRYSCVLPYEFYGSQISPVLRPVKPRLISSNDHINHSTNTSSSDGNVSKPGTFERALSRIGSINRKSSTDRRSEENVSVITSESWLPHRRPLSMEDLHAALEAIPDLEEDNTSTSQPSTYTASLNTPSVSLPSASNRGSLAELRHQSALQSGLKPHKRLPSSRMRASSDASSLQVDDHTTLTPLSQSTPTPSKQNTIQMPSSPFIDVRSIPPRSYSQTSHYSAIDRSPTPIISPRVSSLRHLKHYNSHVSDRRSTRSLDGTPIKPRKKHRKHKDGVHYESVNGTSLGMSEKGKLKSTRRIPGIVPEVEFQIDHLRMTSPIAELEDDEDGNEFDFSAPAPPSFGPRNSTRSPYYQPLKANQEPVLHDPDALDIMNFGGFDSIGGEKEVEDDFLDDDDFTGWQIRIQSDRPGREEHYDEDSDDEFSAEPPSVALYRSPQQQQQRQLQTKGCTSSPSWNDEPISTIRDMLKERFARKRLIISGEEDDAIFT